MFFFYGALNWDSPCAAVQEKATQKSNLKTQRKPQKSTQIVFYQLVAVQIPMFSIVRLLRFHAKSGSFCFRRASFQWCAVFNARAPILCSRKGLPLRSFYPFKSELPQFAVQRGPPHNLGKNCPNELDLACFCNGFRRRAKHIFLALRLLRFHAKSGSFCFTMARSHDCAVFNDWAPTLCPWRGFLRKTSGALA